MPLGFGSYFYYFIKPLVPRRTQLALRRVRASQLRQQYSAIWPIDQNAGKPPAFWKGWPQGKQFGFALIHDVETAIGRDQVPDIMQLETEVGFRSCFNFVPERFYPERYEIPAALRNEIARGGFDVGIHGLTHDGRLFMNRRIFAKRARRINHYLNTWKAVGFTSPSAHHHLSWMWALNIEYGVTTFDTDPFEPQPDGVGTIYPFWVPAPDGVAGYTEMPYTLPQDCTVFVILQQNSIDLWKQKLDWVASQGGLALLNTHPDYMWFGSRQRRFDQYPAAFYREFLHYVKTRYRDAYWHALPRDMARWMRSSVLQPKEEPAAPMKAATAIAASLGTVSIDAAPQ
jgi:hypothetical protein